MNNIIYIVGLVVVVVAVLSFFGLRWPRKAPHGGNTRCVGQSWGWRSAVAYCHRGLDGVVE
jgi:hypothetical protein